MGPGNMIAGALAFWLAASIYFFIKRKRQGLIHLGLKEFYQGCVHIFGWMWLLFLLVGGVLLQTLFVEHLATLNLERWLGIAIAMSSFFALLALFGFLSIKLLRWRAKYTEEEKGILLEERLKLKKKLGWFGKYISTEDLDGNSSSTREA